MKYSWPLVLILLALIPLFGAGACGDDDDDDAKQSDDDPCGDGMLCNGDDDDADDDQDDAPCYNDPTIEAKVLELLVQMSLREKVDEMTAPRISLTGALRMLLLPINMGANVRLGIPALRMAGASRGAIPHGTAFPVSMARGASWDIDLEQRVGEALGLELKAISGNVLLGPTINLLRHPGWGRSQETYGEDPHHLGRFAVASITGTQRHVMAQVKHFALNSIEDDRGNIDIIVDERTLREVYLPHFKDAVLEACSASVMSSYNMVNGQRMGENRYLLRGILKGDWAYDGFVASDWYSGTPSTVDAANNGNDIEMPMKRFYGERLVRAVQRGDVDESVIDEAVTRILRMKFHFGLFDNPPEFDLDVISNPEHTLLTLEVAQESIVLLKNEGDALPLLRDQIGRIAVVGPLANRARMGDYGSSAVFPDYAISPLQGMLNHAGAVEVVSYTGLDPQEAASLAAGADAVVAIAALTFYDEGEQNSPFESAGGDRSDLGLHGYDIKIIEAVAAVNDRVVVVIESGGAVTVDPWIDGPEALLMAWYPGMEGGNAIAQVIYGDVNPSGKMPFTTPHESDPLYEFGTLQPTVEYGYYHGYRWYDHEQLTPRYPFGFGLSYTEFSYGNLQLSHSILSKDGTLQVSFEVTNVGNMAGKEIAQLYVGFPESSVDRPVRVLKGFEKVELAPNETRTVTLNLAAEDLAYYDVGLGEWRIEDGDCVVEVGPSSRDLPLSGDFEVE
jgi:beta-glucosidase